MLAFLYNERAPDNEQAPARWPPNSRFDHPFMPARYRLARTKRASGVSAGPYCAATRMLVSWLCA